MQVTQLLAVISKHFNTKINILGNRENKKTHVVKNHLSKMSKMSSVDI